MNGAQRSSMSWLAAAAALVMIAFAARADEPRRVVVPGAAPVEVAPPARGAGSDDMADLVGPTEAQKQRAKAAAEAKAKAEAEAKAKAEAEAKAKAELEAKARAERERKEREELEARARAEEERKAKAEAARKAEEERQAKLAAEAKAKAEEQARLAREAEERRKAEEALRDRKLAEEEQRRAAEAAARALEAAQAKELAEAKAQADAEARAKAEHEAQLRAEIEKRVREEVEREVRARAAKEAKKAARARAKAEAKARREAKRKGKSAPPPLEAEPVPELPTALVADAKAPESKPAEKAVVVPLAPLVAEPHAPPKSDGTQLAMLMKPAAPAAVVIPPAQPAAPAERRTVAVPVDEQQRSSRQIDAHDELQIGPQGLVLNRLTAGADVTPGVLRATFAYRVVNDDASALHHFFLVGAESAQPPEGVRQEWSWSAQLGLGPSNTGSYGVFRKLGTGPTKASTDSLGWSGFSLAGGAARSFAKADSSFTLGADAQLYGFSVSYTQNVGQSGSAPVNASLDQLRLRATATAASGRVSGLFSLAAHAYLGDSTDKLRGMPMRGAWLQDDLGGLAAAPQGLEAKLGGRLEIWGDLAMAASYSYVGYTSLDWSAAHLVHADLSDRFGHWQAALGFTWQYDAPVVAAPNSGIGDYSTMFLTGSIGYQF